MEALNRYLNRVCLWIGYLVVLGASGYLGSQVAALLTR